MMKVLKVIIGAGGTTSLDVVGNYYRIVSATGAVYVGTDDGDLQQLAKGLGEQTEKEFTRLYIYSEVAQTIEIAVSRGRVDDSRLNLVGAVEVIDGGKARTEAGQAAIGSLYTLGGSGNYCNIELMNPAGSGKNLVLKQFRLGANGTMRVELHNTESAYSVGGPTYFTVKKDVRTAPALAAARMYQGNRVTAQTGNPSFPAMMMGYVSGFSDFAWTFTEPVILGPDQGILWAATSQNISMSLSVEWFEEDQ